MRPPPVAHPPYTPPAARGHGPRAGRIIVHLVQIGVCGQENPVERMCAIVWYCTRRYIVDYRVRQSGPISRAYYQAGGHVDLLVRCSDVVYEYYPPTMFRTSETLTRKRENSQEQLAMFHHPKHTLKTVLE
jgi:hypothetical protein